MMRPEAAPCAQRPEPVIGIGLAPPRSGGPASRAPAAWVLFLLPALPRDTVPAVPTAAFDPEQAADFTGLKPVREAVAAWGVGRVVWDLPLGAISPLWLRQLAEAGIGCFTFALGGGRQATVGLTGALRLVRPWFVGRRAVARLRAGLTRKLLCLVNAGEGDNRPARWLLGLLGRTLPDGRPPARVLRPWTEAPACPLPGPLEAARIVHLIGSLGPGGAERQLCYILRGLAGRGFTAQTLLSFFPLTGVGGHYLPLLADAAVAREVLPHPVAGEGDPFAALPVRQRYFLYAAYRWFKAHPTDILHAWMDYSAIIGGVGALVAGVPRIVLAARNMSPLRFPYLYAHWYRPWYRLLARSDRVTFLNNSRAGAADYATWLGLPVDRFTVIGNAVDRAGAPRPGPEAVRAFRESIGVPDRAPLVAGIFRLSEEKRPLVFVEVLARLLRRVPEARAIHAGIGPLEAPFRRALEQAGLADRVTLLGRREDVPVLLSASTALVLTSIQEGMPNVLLEAQSYGCPVVATRAGGAPDCLIPGVTGFLLARDDSVGMAEALHRLVTDAALHAAMAEAGARLVRERFSIDGMLDRLVGFYRQTVLPAATAARPRERNA